MKIFIYKKSVLPKQNIVYFMGSKIFVINF